jgi:hypothetical protein
VNKPENWVRCNGAYQPIIPAEIFATAQQIINERDRQYTDEELLELLRNLLKHHGMLSGIIINESTSMPSTATYCNRFQSLRRAYELVGYTTTRDYSYLAINRALRAFHHEHLTLIKNQLAAVEANVRRDLTTDLLTINDEFTAALSIARCRELREGEYRWVLRFDTSLDPDITIGARMAPGNTTILDYYLFPSIDVLHGPLPTSSRERHRPGRIPRHGPSLAGQPITTNPATRGRMTTKHPVLIPIQEIRIVNPRSRNRITFQAITASIATASRNPLPSTSGHWRTTAPDTISFVAKDA